jgi:hypothetical protein
MLKFFVVNKMEQIQLMVDQMKFINLILNQQIIPQKTTRVEVLQILASYNIDSRVLALTKTTDLSLLGLYRIQHRINNLNQLIISHGRSKLMIDDNKELA